MLAIFQMTVVWSVWTLQRRWHGVDSQLRHGRASRKYIFVVWMHWDRGVHYGARAVLYWLTQGFSGETPKLLCTVDGNVLSALKTWLSTLSRPLFPDYSITVSSQTTWLTVPKWTPSWSESLFLLGFNCLPFPMSLLKFRPWCWQRLKAGGEGDDRGWDGWTASLTQWPWVGASSGRWWKTGKPGVLQSMGSQTVRHDWAIEPQQCAFQIPASVSTHFHQHESSPTKNTPLPSFSYNMMISNLPFVPILVDNRDDQPLSSTSYLTPTLSPCP